MNRNFSILRCYSAIFALLLFQYGKAQDTTLLQTVNVTALKSLDFSAGKRTDQIDSSTKQNFTFHSLADLLQLNSGIFIKNYGPGALAGTSMRGGNASQTAILWNGINIQNAMLGQNDLSLLPSVMFNDMKVEYGGSSALWGSGAVAGSILLGNKANFKKGFEREVLKGLRISKIEVGKDESYEFLWHRFADFYIEEMKDNIRIGDADALKVLKDVYFRNLKMLHPFIPYVTEAVWQVFHGKESSILG
jgi:hypothetical protein